MIQSGTEKLTGGGEHSIGGGVDVTLPAGVAERVDGKTLTLKPLNPKTTHLPGVAERVDVSVQDLGDTLGPPLQYLHHFDQLLSLPMLPKRFSSRGHARCRCYNNWA
eukprot:1191911-Prorocentrum_minimum.AAC.7